MAVKFMNLQMILWSCFHLMGNRVSCVPFHRHPVGTIKLLRSDGLVNIYQRPIDVSDLMVEFPKHMVCRSDAFYIGQKIPALHAGDQLQLGHSYFLLPNHFFHSVLSFVTIASFSPKNAANCHPFDVQKTASGCLRLKVSEQFMAQLLADQQQQQQQQDDDDNGKVCTTPQLRKEYAQLVRCRQWKPKLETITESKNLSKLASFAKRRKKHSQTTMESRNYPRRSEHRIGGLLDLPRL